MIYINFDVETGGPVPGLHPLLSFGAVAHRENFTYIDEIAVNMDWASYSEGFDHYVNHAVFKEWHPDTENWWSEEEQAAAWEAMKDPEPTSYNLAMEQICSWFGKLLWSEQGPVVLVAYPATFDMPWLNYYMHVYQEERWRNLIHNKHVGFSCLDILTLASALMDKPYLESTKSKWPSLWSHQDVPHTHVAIDDAKCQAYAFIQMTRAMRGLHVAAYPIPSVAVLMCRGCEPYPYSEDLEMQDTHNSMLAVEMGPQDEVDE